MHNWVLCVLDNIGILPMTPEVIESPMGYHICRSAGTYDPSSLLYQLHNSCFILLHIMAPRHAIQLLTRNVGRTSNCSVDVIKVGVAILMHAFQNSLRQVLCYWISPHGGIWSCILRRNHHKKPTLVAITKLISIYIKLPSLEFGFLLSEGVMLVQPVKWRDYPECMGMHVPTKIPKTPASIPLLLHKYYYH